MTNEHIPGSVQITNEEVMAQLRIVPLPTPTRAQLRAIPSGSEVITVFWGDRTDGKPTIGAMVWDEETSATVIGGIQSDLPQTGVFVMYLPPVSNPDTEAIVSDIMRRERMDYLSGFEEINMRRLRAMLTEAATRGGRPF